MMDGLKPFRHLRLGNYGLSVLVGLCAAPLPAQSQVPGPPLVDGKVATPVEITMDVADGQVQCRPPRARLPARNPLQLRVINRSEQMLTFVAPDFFKASKHIESAGFTWDLVRGGFSVAPEASASVLLLTPAIPGEYYYSCYLPGLVPNPESSGFLIVVPAAE